MAAVDITEGEAGEKQDEGAKRGSARLIVIGVIVLLLLGGGVTATLMFYPNLVSGLTGTSPPPASGAAVKPEVKVKAKAPPNYVELGDAFVVNFVEGSRVRYLQVKIEAMTRDPDVATAITTHLPHIRNNLVFLLSAVDYPTISTVEGKEKIRDEALKEVQTILQEEIGKPGVEALYFTSFVVQ